MSDLPLSPVEDTPALSLAEAHADLSANLDARADLRRQVTGVEFRQALRDLRDGLRGMIRVSPLTSVIAAALLGAAWSRRRGNRR